MSFVVAVDGPAGTGKGTITKLVAEKLGFVVIDTGAMYRCVTLNALKENISAEETEKIEKMLEKISIEMEEVDGKQKVLLNGEDVTKEIRTPEIDRSSSAYCAIPCVREKITPMQRKMGEKGNVMMEGRDIGTVVFPHADVKIYLDASDEEIARRRYKQNLEKGMDVTYEQTLEDIKKRNEYDSNRKIAPLKQAEDAIYIDSTKMSIKQVEKAVIKIIKKKQKEVKRIEAGYKETPETTWKKVQRATIKGVLGFFYKIIYRPKMVGLENLPKDEGFIICANHVNYLDAAGLVLCNKFKIRFIGKADLLRFKILSYLARIFDVIPVKRDSGDISSIKICLKALKNKQILGIFPEGTRKGMAKNVQIKNGAVYLAEKAKVKIVPVGVQGTFKPFTKVKFNYGKPIDIEEIKMANEEWQNIASKKVMDDIIMLTKQEV